MCNVTVQTLFRAFLSVFETGSQLANQKLSMVSIRVQNFEIQHINVFKQNLQTVGDGSGLLESYRISEGAKEDL